MYNLDINICGKKKIKNNSEISLKKSKMVMNCIKSSIIIAKETYAWITFT